MAFSFRRCRRPAVLGGFAAAGIVEGGQKIPDATGQVPISPLQL
jgi:hypothetical protein